MWLVQGMLRCLVNILSPSSLGVIKYAVVQLSVMTDL